LGDVRGSSDLGGPEVIFRKPLRVREMLRFVSARRMASVRWQIVRSGADSSPPHAIALSGALSRRASRDFCPIHSSATIALPCRDRRRYDLQRGPRGTIGVSRIHGDRSIRWFSARKSCLSRLLEMGAPRHHRRASTTRLVFCSGSGVGAVRSTFWRRCIGERRWFALSRRQNDPYPGNLVTRPWFWIPGGSIFEPWPTRQRCRVGSGRAAWGFLSQAVSGVRRSI